MSAAIFAFSRKGIATAKRIARCLEKVQIYTAARLAEESGLIPIPQPSTEFYAQQFAQNSELIFVCSCGIAVRAIAPHVRSKTTDPAVLVVDEQGRHVIPLLSGHIGGANALSNFLAAQLGAEPVITTATDLSGKFAVDSWAVQNGFLLSSLCNAKAVSAAILEENIPFCSDFPVSKLPDGLVFGENGTVGICLTPTLREPFDRTLRLIPKCLHIGVGCRKNTSKAAISQAVLGALDRMKLDPRAVKTVASIDLKAHEPGLLDFCREQGFPVCFYTADELRAVPGDFTSSAFVQKVTGVDNVCERAALLGADHLILKKTAENGVTLAIAVEKVEISFE